MWWSNLPAVNASLNALSGVLVLTGFYFIRRRNFTAHRRAMLAACWTSALFLCTYLVYHFFAGSTKFAGTGWSRPVYFSILLSHTVLAMVVLPLVLAAVYYGLKDRRRQHRAVVRWGFPIWVYVSVTGVLVYFFLYHWFPSR